jgi:hypothetical protein
MFVAALGAAVFVVGSAAADPAPTSPPMPAPDATAPPPSAPGVASPAPSAEAPARPAQPAEEERTANNAIFAEGLGPAIFYSINYERSFSDFAARVGFGYLSVSASASSGTQQAKETASVLSVPLTLEYLGIGSKQNMFELGAGATVVHVGQGASIITSDSTSSSSGSTTYVFPHAVIGYRFMPPDGGFLFRIGVSPIFAGNAIAVLPWPYLALGGAF